MFYPRWLRPIRTKQHNTMTAGDKVDMYDMRIRWKRRPKHAVSYFNNWNLERYPTRINTKCWKHWCKRRKQYEKWVERDPPMW